MKYRADQLSNGQYAVFTGRKYFTDTVTDSKAEAKRNAFIESMRWHQWQIDKIEREMEGILFHKKQNRLGCLSKTIERLRVGILGRLSPH